MNAETLSSLSDEQQKFIADNELLIGKKFAALLVNAMSHSNIRSLLSSLLRVNNDDLWVDEVFDEFFIYEDDGKIYKQDYSLSDGSVSFVGERIEVVRVTEFRTIDGKFIGNNRKDQSMEKKKLVDALIANENSQFAEDDRDTLMAMNEDVLARMVPVKNEEAEAPEAETDEAKVETASTEKTGEEAEPASNMSVEEFLKTQVPAGMRGVLTNAVKMHDEAKGTIISALVKNDKCTFTEEFLKTKDLEELQNLSTLAGNDVSDQTRILRFNYDGQGAGGPAQNSFTPGEPLALPSMDEAKTA